MNVRDDTEIDWKLLPDENWNIWSAHSLQRRWLTMKRSIKGFEEMSHAGRYSLSVRIGIFLLIIGHRDYGDLEDKESAITASFVLWAEEEEQVPECGGGERCG